MSRTQERSECKTTCWIIAAIAGVVLMILLSKLIGLGGLWSALLGVIGGLLLAYFLPQYVCTGSESEAEVNAATAAQAPAIAPAAKTDTAEDNVKSEAVAPAAVASSAATLSSAPASNTTAAPLMSAEIKPSTPLAGEAELASRKGAWKYEAPVVEKKAAGTKVAAKKPAAAKADAATKKAAPKKAAAKTAKKAPAKSPAKASAKAAAKAPAKTTTKAPAKAPAKATAKRAPVAADGKPQVYETPPAEGSDDLKLISGVGPKLEQTLNELGIYRFQQVAGWRKKEIEWVDSRLRFKGRIARDDWMSQAKILSKGGETEFSKRKKT